MLERDRWIYYKEGYKYITTRFYRVKTLMCPSTTQRIIRSTLDIDGNPVTIPLVTLEPSGWLTIYPGYAWDGASGPTIDTKDSMGGSAFHDAGYQLMRLGMANLEWKEYIDKVFHEIMIEDGMVKPRADLWLWAVNKFGRGSTIPSAEPMELVAP